MHVKQSKFSRSENVGTIGILNTQE